MALWSRAQVAGRGHIFVFDPVLGTFQLQLNGRVPLLRCTSSLEPELYAILMALAAVPCNSPVIIWCDNLGAVTWLRNTEQLRAGGRIQDYRHDRDRSAPALKALLKTLLTFRTAPLDTRHVPAHQVQPESVEGRMNNVADRLAGEAQELERPSDMLPAADDPAVWFLLDNRGNCIDKHISTWIRGVAQDRAMPRQGEVLHLVRSAQGGWRRQVLCRAGCMRPPRLAASPVVSRHGRHCSEPRMPVVPR